MHNHGFHSVTAKDAAPVNPSPVMCINQKRGLRLLLYLVHTEYAAISGRAFAGMVARHVINPPTIRTLRQRYLSSGSTLSAPGVGITGP